ncbi:MAG: hypothetical protein PHF46_02970 [Candidatus Gracilibacteria bacterium]|nr:hypothetical protein [Candidatus Gracilibacteria bacterium]MDD3120346.1 hypothetical protein [Candidatus Gracilibacteria bacterium]MDD4530348.1 hypothetical protein [Candidatus Gracilibacteria bacterium]
MKNIFLFILGILFLALSFNICDATVTNLDEVLKGTKSVLINPVAGNTPIEKVENGGLNILRTIKLILSIVALAYLVYAGAMMIIGMGDDGKMKDYKKSFYFILVGLMFINIPGTLYSIFDIGRTINGDTITGISNFSSTGGTNVFYDNAIWKTEVENGILKFLEYGIIAILFVWFMIVGLNFMTSQGNDEKKKMVKNDLLIWFLGILFLGSVKVWREVAVKANIEVTQNLLFNNLINLGIFFAGPVALFFICWGGYFYITAAGDESKVKKGKLIFLNVFIAILILLASYTVLYDFKNLTF